MIFGFRKTLDIPAKNVYTYSKELYHRVSQGV